GALRPRMAGDRQPDLRLVRHRAIRPRLQEAGRGPAQGEVGRARQLDRPEAVAAGAFPVHTAISVCESNRCRRSGLSASLSLSWARTRAVGSTLATISADPTRLS